MLTIVRVARSGLCVLAAAAVVLGAHPVDGKLAANKLAANKLAANKLAANKLAANKLAANKLSANGFAGNPEALADLLATDEGREVLGFLVSCALPAGMTLTVADPGGGDDFQFFGEIGLAKSWLKRPLSKGGRAWISACMLARVNSSDVPLPISLRGSHGALAASDEEVEGWTLEEGAFYGDIFTPEGDPTVYLACRGRDQAAGETGGLIERDCAEPDPGDPSRTPCGFVYAGDCGDFAPSRTCRNFLNRGFYVDCHDQPITKGARKFNKVITVFAAP